MHNHHSEYALRLCIKHFYSTLNLIFVKNFEIDESLVGYRINFGGSSMDVFKNGFIKAAGNVDVLNNSWGLSTMFWDSRESTSLSGFFTALEDLAEIGRGGLDFPASFNFLHKPLRSKIMMHHNTLSRTMLKTWYDKLIL